jgi:hypothetical protein
MPSARARSLHRVLSLKADERGVLSFEACLELMYDLGVWSQGQEVRELRQWGLIEPLEDSSWWVRG